MNDLRGVLRGLTPDGDERTPLASSFLRGLTLGALAGAVIAGSAVLQRRQRGEAEGSSGAGAPAGDAPHAGDAIGAEPGGADGPGDHEAAAEPQALGRS